MNDRWRIESRQKRVLGLGGHNYLALVQPDGREKSRILGHNVGGLLRNVPDIPNLEDIDGSHVILREGDDRAMIEEIERMRITADRLVGSPSQGAEGAVKYSLFGPNSNSHHDTVLKQHGIDPAKLQRPNGKWAPGSGFDLRDPQWRRDPADGLTTDPARMDAPTPRRPNATPPGMPRNLLPAGRDHLVQALEARAAEAGQAAARSPFWQEGEDALSRAINGFDALFEPDPALSDEVNLARRRASLTGFARQYPKDHPIRQRVGAMVAGAPL